MSTQQVSSLNPIDQTTLTFACNTTGIAYSNYTVSACAWPVTNETLISNINLTEGVVQVTIPSDLKCDFKLSLRDLPLLAKAYNTQPDDARCNANVDLNCDGTVGLSDLSITTKHYSQHYL
jgi:hypothetical protein